MCDRGNRYNQKEHLSLKGLPKINFIELEKLEDIKQKQKRELACKNDWGNSCYCKICLSVNDCPVM